MLGSCGGRACPASRPQHPRAGIPAGRYDEHPLHLRRRLAGLDRFISARTQGTSMVFGANVRSADERSTGQVLRESTRGFC